MVRLGIVGRNFVVDWMMAAAAQVPQVKPVAIYSRTMEGAREFADKYQLPLTFDSLEALAACPEVDAVYLASPNSCHYQQAALMLTHGKHVLCEKPVTSNSRELAQLLKLAQENRVVFLEAMRLVHDDALDVIRTALPRIGQLRRVTMEFTQYSSRYDRVRSGQAGINAFDPSLSNGSIMDMGCYCVHALACLFGRPDRVCAVGSKLPSGFDANGIIAMQYSDFVAEAVYSKVSKQVAPTAFMGEEGSILLDDVNHIKRIWLRLRNGNTEELPYEEKQPNNMMYELRHFCSMISGGMDPTPWHQASIITMEILDEARRQMGIIFPADSRPL